MSGFQNGQLILDNEAFTTSSGENDDVPVSGSLLYVVVSNDLDSITGLQAPLGGALVFVVNIGPTNNLVISNNSSSSTAGNRILTYSGSDVTVAPFQTALVGYDTVNSEWHLVKFA